VDAASGFDAWALTLAVFLPAIGALVMMAVPRAREFELKTIALGASLASLAVGVYLLFAFDYSDAKGASGYRLGMHDGLRFTEDALVNLLNRHGYEARARATSMDT